MASNITPIMSISAGGLRVWELSEGDTKFLYAMKLMTPKDLGSTIQSQCCSLRFYYS